MKAKQVILSRLLPKTGQTVQFRNGDDGTFEAGWWKNRLIADNKTRFIAKTIDGDDVVLDLATGLMWPVDGNEAGCNNGGTLNWNGCIDYALALDFAGFTDWRLPNINELASLINYEKAAPFLPDGFVNIISSFYMSSTTVFGNTNNCWSIDLLTPALDNLWAKASLNYLMCVRGGV